VKSGPTFQTDHIYLAAFLICHGHELVSVLAGERGLFRFGFPDTSGVRSSAGEYMAGGLVDARQFAFELLKLKRRIPRHSDVRNVRRASHEADHKRFETSG
jgi:hypothetical protein